MRDDFPPHPAFKTPATADDPTQPPGALHLGLVQPAEPVRAWRIVAAGAFGAGFLGMIIAIAAPKGFPGAPDTRSADKPQMEAAANLPNYRPIGGRYAPPDRDRIIAAYREVAKVSATDGVGAVARASMDCFQKLARQADYGLMDFCLALDAFGAETYAKAAGEAAPPSTYFGQGPVRRQQAVQRLTAGQTDANSRLLDTNRLIQEVALLAPDVPPPPPPPPPEPTLAIAAAEPVVARLLPPTPLAPMPAPAAGPAVKAVQVAKDEPKSAPLAHTVTPVSNKPAPALPVQATPAPAFKQAALAKPAAAPPRPVKMAKAAAAEPSKLKLAKAARKPPVPLKPAPKRVLAKAEPKTPRPLLQLHAPSARPAKEKPPSILAQRAAPAVKPAPPVKTPPVQVAKAEPVAPPVPAAATAPAKPMVVAERAPAPEPRAEVREARHEEPVTCRGRTRGERMVCQEPALAAADKRLSAAFSRALDQAPNPRALVAEQNRWLARRDALAPDAGAVMAAYQDRIAELRDRGR